MKTVATLKTPDHLYHQHLKQKQQQYHLNQKLKHLIFKQQQRQHPHNILQQPSSYVSDKGLEDEEIELSQQIGVPLHPKKQIMKKNVRRVLFGYHSSLSSSIDDEDPLWMV